MLHQSEDFSLLVTFLLVTFSWLFCGFFVALISLEKQCLGLFRGFFRGFFVTCSWLFRGPRFEQILRVLALEKSSESDVCLSCVAKWGQDNRVPLRMPKGPRRTKNSTIHTKMITVKVPIVL